MIQTTEERMEFECRLYEMNQAPKPGTLLSNGQIRTAGDYILGPVLGALPVHSMIQCLARKKNTDEFYMMKILTVREDDKETQDDRQGKMLLHTEHSLLSLLAGHTGVIQQHGMFQDYAADTLKQTDAISTSKQRPILRASGKVVRRMCLVLDCVVYHDFDPQSVYFINLQHYVIGCRKLKELDALTIFYDIVSIVKNLHELNVVHRDIKLANLVLSRRSRKVILTNFCLGQHLVSENDKLQDQRGSPAYISPDVLSGKPYLGKPSDMWALGVLIYTMLFGQFPFYDKLHQELFKKIKSAKYTIPANDSNVRGDTLDIIKGLLKLDPVQRLTAHQVLVRLTSIIIGRTRVNSFTLADAQVVPGEEQNETEQLESLKNTNDSVNTLQSVENDGFNIDFLIERNEKDLIDRSLTSMFNSTSNNFRNRKSYSFIHSKGYDNGMELSKPVNISIVEGDIRTFSQADLFTHRSLFPSMSGSNELFSNWRSSQNLGGTQLGRTPSGISHPTRLGAIGQPSSLSRIAAQAANPPSALVRPPPQPVSQVSNQSTNPLNYSTGQTPLRIPQGPLPPHIPYRLNAPARPTTLSSSQSLYDFAPLRRWTLAVMHRSTASSNGTVAAVPERESLHSVSSRTAERRVGRDNNLIQSGRILTSATLTEPLSDNAVILDNSDVTESVLASSFENLRNDGDTVHPGSSQLTSYESSLLGNLNSLSTEDRDVNEPGPSSVSRSISTGILAPSRPVSSASFSNRATSTADAREQDHDRENSNFDEKHNVVLNMSKGSISETATTSTEESSDDSKECISPISRLYLSCVNQVRKELTREVKSSILSGFHRGLNFSNDGDAKSKAAALNLTIDSIKQPEDRNSPGSSLHMNKGSSKMVKSHSISFNSALKGSNYLDGSRPSTSFTQDLPISSKMGKRTLVKSSSSLLPTDLSMKGPHAKYRRLDDKCSTTGNISIPGLEISARQDASAEKKLRKSLLNVGKSTMKSKGAAEVSFIKTEGILRFGVVPKGDTPNLVPNNFKEAGPASDFPSVQNCQNYSKKDFDKGYKTALATPVNCSLPDSTSNSASEVSLGSLNTGLPRYQYADSVKLSDDAYNSSAGFGPKNLTTAGPVFVNLSGVSSAAGLNTESSPISSITTISVSENEGGHVLISNNHINRSTSSVGEGPENENSGCNTSAPSVEKFLSNQNGTVIIDGIIPAGCIDGVESFTERSDSAYSSSNFRNDAENFGCRQTSTDVNSECSAENLLSMEGVRVTESSVVTRASDSIGNTSGGNEEEEFESGRMTAGNTEERVNDENQ